MACIDNKLRNKQFMGRNNSTSFALLLLQRSISRARRRNALPARMSAFKIGEDCMECDVKWTGNGMSFLAETGSNHIIAMDGAPESGGRNLAPRPMEMLLAGAGGCTAFDVVLILKKGRHAISGCEVKVQAVRADEDPKVFTQIHFHFRVSGTQLKPNAVARAIELSSEKYCSQSCLVKLPQLHTISRSSKTRRSRRCVSLDLPPVA